MKVYNKEIKLSQKTKRGYNDRSKLLTVFFAVSLIILCIFVVMFISSYKNLKESIQAERVGYVSEISAQIIKSQKFMEREYSGAVKAYARILSSDEINTQEDIRNFLKEKRSFEILLVGDDGKIVDLEWNAVFLTERTLMESLNDNEDVIKLFTSLNNEDDYWLFATGTETFEIGEENYSGIVLAVPADQFRDSLAVSLFDNKGASFVIEKNGAMSIRPYNDSAVFAGYNLFSAMTAAGADEKDVAELMDEISVNLSGNHLIDIQGAQWLMSYSSDDARNETVVVAIPLTITAATTYDGLANTIICAVLVVITMAMIAIMAVMVFFRRDRERRKEAMAVAAKSDFFSKMSHDIRTPLNAVMSLGMLAKDSLDDPETAASYLSKSYAAADYLLSIINDVLDMERIESGKMAISNAPFDMNRLLDDICPVIAHNAEEKNISFIVDVDEKFEYMYSGDSVRIKQILMNLLSNGVKFTKEGGCVKLEVRHQPDTEGRDAVTLVVRDNGIGMSNKYLSRIFIPFEQESSSYTEQYKGSGLGLAIVDNLVSLMGGTIEVESEIGKGTVFKVRLSLVRGEKVTESSRERESEIRSYKGARVLLAEDNTINQQIAVAILKNKFEIEAEVASDGRKALHMFADSEPEYYHLILMDIKMPDMDGIEAACRIRGLDREDAASIPIIALSANAFESDRELSLKAGMNEHLAKPVDIKALAAVFEKYIKKEEE